MQVLTVGKRRGLAACATENGVFSILALDHRNNLRNAMNPANPELVSPRIMGEFKSKLIREVAGAGSAALLDPEYGAAPVILSDALSGQTGLVMAVEATGYTGDPNARESAVLEGWSVAKICRMGASALKLLVYYHPDSDLAGQQEDLIASVAEDCRKYDLPFFIEPLSYSLDPQKKLTSAQKRDVVVRTAERLTALDVDVLKAEFPLDVKKDQEEKNWEAACSDVSQALSLIHI
jgi:tagatose-1,6-bisphosphate aldolase